MKPGEAAQQLDGQLIAKARDDWKASEEGQRWFDPSILSAPHLVHYLENRLEEAFLAGVDAGAFLQAHQTAPTSPKPG